MNKLIFFFFIFLLQIFFIFWNNHVISRCSLISTIWKKMSLNGWKITILSHEVTRFSWCKKIIYSFVKKLISRNFWQQNVGSTISLLPHCDIGTYAEIDFTKKRHWMQNNCVRKFWPELRFCFIVFKFLFLFKLWILFN